MKTLKCLLLFSFVCTGLLSSCKEDDYVIPKASFEEVEGASPAKAELVKESGKWKMTVNGRDFYIKGVASNNFYTNAALYGANTIRTYGVSDQSRLILDSAYHAGLFVNFGLYLKRETDGFDYNNEVAVKAQFEEMKAAVNRFKDHPALLVWSIGNEAEASYTNTKLWDAMNDIAEMIHEIDPNHPTTTALASSNVEHIKNIMEKAPEIDILSVNSYAPNLPGVLSNIRSAGWTKPYLITEFGPRGTWQMSPEPTRVLPWGGLVEQTSSEKEAIYLDCYQNYIAANKDNGCLGSFVFLWGYQTHGEVLNWYGLFDKRGFTYPAVDAMQYVWTGQYPVNRAPVIATRNDVLMNGLKAEAAITVSKTSSNTAVVTASDPDGDPLTYEWMIMKEGSAASDGSLPAGISGLIDDNTKNSITFKAPSETGAFRLYVFVRDAGHEKVASAVIPFLVQ
ncbi:glycosyl hydrolase family 2 [Arcticibacter tournemirensis]|uniref:Glycosyl hydrolase family 2 n=1 Tax=Arcticibacter tournemirensis TaxID=699437 RepID=A0A5M9HE44_9SPHI|nr:glycoside hydrolase family 2 TIM barrel-domain containing protein [Arcticibacter tournemirensis]KAA8485050.1 glycosyl hydrolase family 2 [Arcticibacter tournemirensis]TQM50494.1 glycosyl hydrolase family 2 [Arcticibacter tournemirensis]